jgi:mannose-1-phosphate guanylyltransferase
VAVFPTDHFVDDDHAFIAHVARAAGAISHMPEKIAILGIVPDCVETGYGYILPSDPLEFSNTYNVEAFVEKPGPSSARHIISNGGLWNTFVMVFRISRMLDLVRELVPHHFRKLSQLRQFPEKAAELYRTLEPWNFSTQVLSMIPEHLIVVGIDDVHWSDWGTRESVERTYKALNMIPFWNVPSPVTHPFPG